MAGTTNRVLVTWIVIGVIGWAGLGWIALQLDAGSSDQVGFDLQLLFDGAREIAAGKSPYDPAMLAGNAPAAPSLFYSYPPLVAQALVPLAGIPSRVALFLWDAAAVVGLLVVAEALRRRYAPDRGRMSILIPVVAAAPLVLPFAIGLLFGNLDVFFPLLYGAMLLAAVSSSRGTRIAGGLGLLGAMLKLHPASLVAWFAVRAAREPARGRHLIQLLAVAIAGGVSAVALSVVLWGLSPWADYRQVVVVGTGAEIVDRRNAGIAVQVALLVGGGEGTARVGHLVVGVIAIGLTIVAAWRRADPLESFAWAAVASLSTLPVTWYHYPSALIPIALAAVLRGDAAGSGRATRRLVLGAGVVAAIAISVPPLIWVAAGLVIMATRLSGRLSEREPPLVPGPAQPILPTSAERSTRGVGESA